MELTTTTSSDLWRKLWRWSPRKQLRSKPKTTLHSAICITWSRNRWKSRLPANHLPVRLRHRPQSSARQIRLQSGRAQINRQLPPPKMISLKAARPRRLQRSRQRPSRFLLVESREWRSPTPVLKGLPKREEAVGHPRSSQRWRLLSKYQGKHLNPQLDEEVRKQHRPELKHPSPKRSRTWSLPKQSLLEEHHPATRGRLRQVSASCFYGQVQCLKCRSTLSRMSNCNIQVSFSFSVEAAPKKRKSGELRKDQLSPQKKKRVSFGGQLSPELFDKRLPPNSPLRKGATPRRSLMVFRPKSTLLRRASVIGLIKVRPMNLTLFWL